MSTRARVTHTPCGQPIDLSDSNRILEPDTDIEHRCPVTNGPTTVVRHGTRWTVEHILDPTQKQPLYATPAATASGNGSSATPPAARSKTTAPPQPNGCAKPARRSAARSPHRTATTHECHRSSEAVRPNIAPNFAACYVNPDPTRPDPTRSCGWDPRRR
jgi:hypothetical protein